MSFVIKMMLILAHSFIYMTCLQQLHDYNPLEVILLCENVLRQSLSPLKTLAFSNQEAQKVYKT